MLPAVTVAVASVAVLVSGNGIIMDPVETPAVEKAMSEASAHYGAVLRLNNNIFKGNVLRDSDDPISHWIVSWCPHWWEPCQELVRPYTNLAVKWQSALNSDLLLKLQVRFATVDCATDKPLCNAMGVRNYPTVQHYHKGKLVGTWIGQSGPATLANWVEQELQESSSATKHADEKSAGEAATNGNSVAKSVTALKATLAKSIGSVDDNAMGFVRHVAVTLHAKVIAYMGRSLEPEEGLVVVVLLSIGFLAAIHTRFVRNVEMVKPQPFTHVDRYAEQESMPVRQHPSMERSPPQEQLRQRTIIEL